VLHKQCVNNKHELDHTTLSMNITVNCMKKMLVTNVFLYGKIKKHVKEHYVSMLICWFVSLRVACKKSYCESILFRGVFNYVEFVGKTIHEFKYPQNKIPSVRLSNLLVNNVNIWYEPCILHICNVI